MSKAILTAVAKFTELKPDKNYKLSALVILCEDYVASNADITSEDDFFDFLFSMSFLPNFEELVLAN